MALAAVAAAAAAAGWVLDLAGLPSAVLFGALVVGLVAATAGLPRGRPPLAVPGPANTVAQAVLGVLTGALVQPHTLGTLSADWLPVLASVLGTLLVSVLGTLLVSVLGGLVLFAVLATAVSTGADTTLVLAVQVLRLVVMLALAPVLAVLLGRRPSGPS